VRLVYRGPGAPTAMATILCGPLIERFHTELRAALMLAGKRTNRAQRVVRGDDPELPFLPARTARGVGVLDVRKRL
jgi:hypothetical protein